MASNRRIYDAGYVRDVSEKVYRLRLIDAGGADEPDRMIQKDGDNGEKLRARAGSYDALTRAYLNALDIEGRKP